MARNVTTDRRARRTRTLLQAALVELILERGYDRVTVRDILDRADVGRSTFYNHYPSKDDLLLSRVHELDDAVRALIATSTQNPDEEQSTSLMTPLQPLFDHADAHRPLCLAMLASSRATDLAHRLGSTLFSDSLTTHLRSRLAVTDENRLDLAVTFVINGMFGILGQCHPAATLSSKRVR
jgi:AcrR family transcriptional regulator